MTVKVMVCPPFSRIALISLSYIKKKYWLLLLSIIHTLWGTEHCNKVFRYNSMLQLLLNTSPLSNMMGFTENFYRRKTKRWMGKET